MSDQLRLELVDTWPDSIGSTDIFGALSGRHVPLWLPDGEPREVMITRVSGDGGSPQRLVVEAHYTGRRAAPPADSPDQELGSTFLGWRVESFTEQ